MPFVDIKMWKGKTDKQKKAMIREVTKAISKTCDCPVEKIQIAITEYEPKHWGKAGVPGDEISK